MGFFRKSRKGDVVDFTEMQRRGILPKSDFKSESQDVIDFSSSSANSANSITSNSDDFLGGLAAAGDVGIDTYSSRPITNSLREARTRKTENNVVNELKLRMEDNEFKVETLSAKIREIERVLRDKGI